MSWYWNEKSQRYHWRNGSERFLSREEVLGYVNESIQAAESVTDYLAGLVSEAQLAPADWRDLMRQEIKSEYIRQYVLGIGGREQMTPADWGRVGAMLKAQYKFLDGFTDALPDLSEAQITARARQYVDSARQAFEKANQLAQIKAGMDEVLWVTEPKAETCEDCEAFENMGWQLIEDDPYEGAFPGSGDTVCLGNCQCHEEYRKKEGL